MDFVNTLFNDHGKSIEVVVLVRLKSEIQCILEIVHLIEGKKPAKSKC